MLTEDRYQKILKLLDKHQTVSLNQLKNNLKASESTIRRDLSHLEKENKLSRIHGGAKKKLVFDSEYSMSEKTTRNSHEKDLIARYAVSLIEQGDLLYLDAGTTTLAMLPYLKGKDIKIVTNGVLNANILADLDIETILLGGRIKASTKAVIGSQALKQLEHYRFSKVFLGINGIDREYGLTTPDSEEALLKRTAMNATNDTYFLADSSKFNKVTFCHVADLEGQTILTNDTDKNLTNPFKNLAIVKEISE